MPASAWTEPPSDPAAAAILEQAALLFSPGNEAGVHGYALTRAADGAGLELVVFRSDAARRRGAVAPSVKGARIRWVPVEPARPATRALPTYTGVHPGAAVSAASTHRSSPVRRTGGIAAVLETDDGALLAVTAGHLFAPGSAGTLHAAADGVAAADLVGEVVLNQLDVLPPRLGFPLDAALVELNSRGRALASTGRNWSALEGGAAGPGELDGRSTMALLPTRQRVSGTSLTTYPAVFLPVDRYRGAYEVRGVIAALPGPTLPGDSGTLLFGASNPHVGMGLCVGLEIQGPSVFEPLARVVFHASAQLGRRLRIWPGPPREDA